MSNKRISFKLGSEEEDSLYADITEKSAKLAKAGKSVRQELIRADSQGVEGRISAVIEIQRVYRGYVGRYGVYSQYVDDDVVEEGLELESGKSSSSPDLKSEKSLLLETSYVEYKQEMMKAGRQNDILTFEEFCKTAVRLTQEEKNEDENIGWRRFTAAVTIQRWWRKHLDMNVYKYYRDLINFRQKGDPAMMLRCINPSEAKLIDAASGIHVKFRLAGTVFPPHIYYKVFTHRPVQDVGAFAPRDYTLPMCRMRLPRQIHNRTSLTYNPRDRTGWYKRVENNGWRIVSDQMIQRYTKSIDPVTLQSASKRLDFHYSKLQRRADIEKRRKQRKIQWMQKLYKQGMLHARVEEPTLVRCVENAAKWLDTTADLCGGDTIEDWEVDELLDWTTALDFDEYWTDWKQLATSNLSDAPVMERIHLHASTHDPYSLTLRTEPPHNITPSGRSAQSDITRRGTDMRHSGVRFPSIQRAQ